MSIFKNISEDLNALWNSIKHVFSDDVEPFIKSTVDLLERNGGSLLLKIAADVAPDLATMQWGVAIAQILVDLKNAGVVTVAQEEQLAASTALQLAQVKGQELLVAAQGQTQDPNPVQEAQTGTLGSTADASGANTPGEANAAASA